MKGIVRLLVIIVLVILVAGVGGYFVLPPRAGATETINVERPPAAVFAYLSATPAGTVVAEGVTATEVASAENNVVVVNVAFADQTAGTATYTVRPEGAGSQVSLKIERPLGPNPLDRVQALTGGEVKPLVEAAATSLQTELTSKLNTSSFEALQYSVVQVPARPFVYNENCSPIAPGEIERAVAESLDAVRPYMTRHRLTQDGPPIAIETSWNDTQYCFQIGYAYTGNPPPRSYTGIKTGQTVAGAAVRVTYQGPEAQVIPTYDRMENLIASARLTKGKSFEIYHDDPAQAGSVNREIFYIVTGDNLSRLQAVLPATAAAVAPPATPAEATAPAAATPAAAGTPAPTTPAQAPAPATTP